MLRFILCDDNPEHNQTLENLLKEIIAKHKLAAVVAGQATTPEEILEFARGETGERVYFMDLDFGEGQRSGLEVARELRLKDARSYIVYISAHQEYLLECFQTKGSDFLIKPFAKSQLEQCLLGIFRDRELMQRENLLSVRIGSRSYFVPQREILYLEKQREYVCAVLENRTFRWRESTAALLGRLEEGMFCQIHKGYIVNLRHVYGYDATQKQVMLMGGLCLPVARSRRVELERALANRTEACHA